MNAKYSKEEFEERVNKILSAYGDNPNIIVISNHLNAWGQIVKV